MDNAGISSPSVRRRLFQKAARLHCPINGTFELTPRCNMDCRMCYIRMSETEMRGHGRLRTAAEWIEMGRICRDNGMLFLLLTGGEPFFRPDFREIYTALSQMGLVISINSNGTLIDAETVDWLRQYPPTAINVTLYGSSNETYARLCRNPKGYDQATQAIDRLLDTDIPVNLNTSFTPLNVEDMEDIYAFAKSRNLNVRSTCYMFPPVRSARCGAMEEGASRFSPQEAGAALYRSRRCQMNDEGFSRFLTDMRLGMPSEDDTEDCNRTPDEHMGCMAGRSSFCITWDGRMTPCGMMNAPAARPFEDGFGESWKTICAKADRILLPAACTGCKKRYACTVCGALTMAEGQGDSTRKPEYLCQMTDTFLSLCGRTGQ